MSDMILTNKCWHCDTPLTSRPPAEPICGTCFSALTGIRLDVQPVLDGQVTVEVGAVPE